MAGAVKDSVITLRPYQQEAVDSIYRFLRERDDNPCVVIPTAGGKTPVLATICRDAVTKWSGRVLVLAHVKELLEQATEKLHIMAPDLWNKIGVYSAGLKCRDTEHPIIVAGIQSVYKRACELDAFDLIIIDECHLLPVEGEGMYRTFLTDAKKINPNVRLIGLTATPYRLSTGINIPDELKAKLAIECTQSSGWHVMYRCSDEVSGNLKLAQRKHTVTEDDEIVFVEDVECVRLLGKDYKIRTDEDGARYAIVTLIETRGEGGIFLCAPTAGYELLQGDICDLPVITPEERDVLLMAAWELNEHIELVKPAPPVSTAVPGEFRPGDDFNARGDIAPILQKHGWTYVRMLKIHSIKLGAGQVYPA